MRRNSLLLFVCLLPQVSAAFQLKTPQCMGALDRSYKAQMEQLMNQFSLGEIDRSEFEMKREEVHRFYMEDSGACAQEAFSQREESVNNIRVIQVHHSGGRVPASVTAESNNFGGVYEEVDGSGWDE